MKIISHRGNIRGPVPEKENRPSYIDSAINIGYDVEVDLRFIDGAFWLGHDEPQYKVELSWMYLRSEKLWFHCKDVYSALELSKLKTFKYFCHSSDAYVATSTGHLWLHDISKSVNEYCIIPLISDIEARKYNEFKDVYGICTDFPIGIISN
jgi:hypothetical protein